MNYHRFCFYSEFVPPNIHNEYVIVLFCNNTEISFHNFIITDNLSDGSFCGRSWRRSPAITYCIYSRECDVVLTHICTVLIFTT